eukprot:3502900-Prymnesium_polylepis.1
MGYGVPCMWMMYHEIAFDTTWHLIAAIIAIRAWMPPFHWSLSGSHENDETINSYNSAADMYDGSYEKVQDLLKAATISSYASQSDDTIRELFSAKKAAQISKGELPTTDTSVPTKANVGAAKPQVCVSVAGLGTRADEGLARGERRESTGRATHSVAASSTWAHLGHIGAHDPAVRQQPLARLDAMGKALSVPHKPWAAFAFHHTAGRLAAGPHRCHGLLHRALRVLGTGTESRPTNIPHCATHTVRSGVS